MNGMQPLSPLVVGQLSKSAGIVFPVHTEIVKTVNFVHTEIEEVVIVDYGANIDNAPVQMLQLKRVYTRGEELGSPAPSDLYSTVFPVDPIHEYFQKEYDRIEGEYANRLDALNRAETHSVGQPAVVEKVRTPCFLLGVMKRLAQCAQVCFKYLTKGYFLWYNVYGRNGK